MPTEQIEISYVNQPKVPRGPGSIKSAVGDYYKVWPKEVPLGNFQVGGIYRVDYEEDEYQGKLQKTIKRALPVGPVVIKGNAGAPAQKVVTQAARARTNPDDAERMWTCALVTAAVQSGKVDLLTESEVLLAGQNALNTLRRLFPDGRSHQAKLYPESAAEFNDEIPDHL